MQERPIRTCPILKRDCLSPELCPLAVILEVSECPLEVFPGIVKTVMKAIAKDLDDSLDDTTKKAIFSLIGLRYRGKSNNE